MKKISTLAKVAVALFLGATAATANAQYPQAQELVIGQAYSGFTWSNDAPGTCLKYTAPENGLLTIVQGGIYDSHLYDEQWTGQSNWDNVYGTTGTGWFAYAHQIESDNGYQSGDTAPYSLKYSLVKGQTVYYYARIDATDNVSIVNTIWEASGDPGYPVAQIGVPFNAYTEVYQYTPTTTGVMTVYQSTSGFTAGADFSFLYTNPTCNTASQVLPNNTVISDDMTWKFNVTAGTTYYFRQRTNAGMQFTIQSVKEQLTPTVTLVGAQPAPGTGSLDDFSYVGGISLNLAPVNGVAIATATFKYVTPAGETVSKPLTAQYNGGSNWSIQGVRDYYIEAMQGAAKPASMCSVVLEGLTVNGATAEAANDLDPTYVSCNGDSMTIQYYIPDEYGFQLSKAEWPQVIYQTWPEAGQSNGIATLIFNNNIKAVGEVTMVYGHHTPGAISGTTSPTYIVPYDIKGNQLVLDFTAAYEDPEVVPDGNLNPSEVTVMLVGIQNEYGILWGDNGMNTMVEYIPFNSGTAPEPAPTMAAGVVMSPEDGNSYAIDTEFEGFVISYWDAEEGGLEFATNNQLVDLYVGGNKAGTVTATIEDNQLIIGLGEYAGKNAEYMVWIEQGFVKNSDGLVNAGQGVSCKVLEENNEYTLTPEDGSELIGAAISVVYPGSTLLVNESCPTPLSWANNRYVGEISVAGDKFEIPLFVDVMDPGTYDLVIPATYFVINASSLNGEIKASYVVTENTVGVEGLVDADANGLYTVYNMAGVKVAAGKADVVKTLNKGLYIINGKKVIIK